MELVSRTSNHQAERSEPLVIDTHRAPEVVPSSGEPSRAVSPGVSAVSSPLLSVLVNRGAVGEVTVERSQQMELLAGTGTAVLLFLVVIGALAWRCRRYSLTSGSSTIRSKKLVEDVPICRTGEFEFLLSVFYLFLCVTHSDFVNLSIACQCMCFNQ